MSAPRHSVRQSDVTRAIKGAVSAGVDIIQVEIDPETGRIVIFPASTYNSPAKRRKKPNPWDEDCNGAPL